MTPKYLIFPFFCTLLACLGLARLAPWIALMDKPDARKRHGRDVPVVGGIAMRFVFLAGAAAFGGENGVAAMAWLWMVCASLASATAYALDRRPPGDHDIALWVHLLAAFAAMVASVTLLNQFDGLRHLLLAGSFVLAFLSVTASYLIV